MKKILNLLFFLATALLYAQLEDFTVTATKVRDVECPNAGSISWEVSGNTTGVMIYTVIDSQGKKVLSTDELQTSNLLAGDFRVVATQTSGQYTKQATSNVVHLDNKYIPLDITSIYAQPAYCDNGVIYVYATGTGELKYSYRKEGETSWAETNTTGEFAGLSVGTYEILVVDGCGASRTGVAAVSKGRSSWGVSTPRHVVIDCEKVVINNYFRGIIPYPYTVTITAKNPKTGQTETFGLNEDGELIVPYWVANEGYSLTIKDNCGKTVTKTIGKPNNVYRISQFETGSCGNPYLSIGSPLNFTKAFRVVKFTKAPSGFNPQELNDDHGKFLNSHTYGKADGVPVGDYEFIIEDQCGVRTTQSITITQYDVVKDFIVETNFTSLCNARAEALVVSGREGSAYQIGTVKITAAPESFVEKYGALPYTVPEEYFGVSRGSGRRIMQLPVDLEMGKTESFSIEVTPECGDGFTYQRTIEVTNQPLTIPDPPTIEDYCDAVIFRSNAEIQKYSPEMGWGWDDGNGFKEGKSKNINSDYVFREPGKYRAIDMRLYYTLINGVYYDKYCPPTPLKEFTIGEGNLKFINAYAFPCEDGKHTLAIAAEGTGLQYALVSGQNSDATLLTEYQDTPHFTGLPGGTYFIRIKDSCGNFITEKKEITQLNQPEIEVSGSCEDGKSNFHLQISALDFLQFKWYKYKDAQGNLIENPQIISTESFIDIVDFKPEDAGTYKVEISSDDATACVEGSEVVIFSPDAATNPKAGTGKTVEINYDGSQQSLLNLFDYLEGSYDSFGTWEEVGSIKSYMQEGNYFDITWAGNGTYQFRYTVNAVCGGGSDSTVVTIHLNKLCYKEPKTDGTKRPTLAGITALERAGTLSGDNWPMVRQSGWVALEANKKGFVLNRLSTAQINAIANPQAGMMAYDTDEKCMKIYDGTGWKCLTKQTCPN
ncbi:hypothetical protein IMZ16_08175 [Cruoricaptor ignavus]|uniref:SprB repeat-containing protein n=1 Tax=Cruoricaptor ignavus TaxID=1118202 RepID=A0A7M1T2Y0_9FLAO|nr:hypothetical protein [Cruoricaptor ignavus]QOR73494.1 hypothetical protein IMZ16_08175 [Cruoricaptor ignavus]